MYLTRRQKEILDFLETHITRKGYAPTIEEIGEKFGLSSLATVHKHLTNLQKKGLVKRDWNRSRGLELVPTQGEARETFALRRQARVLRDALEKLKPTERDALALRYVADLSHREIAEACGLDEAAARKRVSRALQQLRSVMPTEEIE